MRNVEKHEEKVVIGGGPDDGPLHTNIRLPWPFNERPPNDPDERIFDPNG